MRSRSTRRAVNHAKRVETVKFTVVEVDAVTLSPCLLRWGCAREVVRCAVEVGRHGTAPNWGIPVCEQGDKRHEIERRRQH